MKIHITLFSIPLNKYRITGHLYFLVLLVLAGIFYKERVLYADSAWQIYKIINFSSFNIEAGRYGTVLTQIITLFAVRQELPLRFVILYRISMIGVL